ncbi:toxin-antitoxin system, toxin component [Streptomyces sp. NPDC055078]
MKRRAMRRVCASLVRGLDVPPPAGPGQLIDALCRRVAERSGRAVRHTLVPFPPRTVSGLWIATGDTDHILCELRTSPWHQLLITCHEIWHIVEPRRSGDGAGSAPALSGMDLGTLDASALGRIMAARGPYDAASERDADLFASLLLARLTRTPPRAGREVPGEPALHRVERTLGSDGDEGFVGDGGFV